jgi:hypothetical protein
MRERGDLRSRAVGPFPRSCRTSSTWHPTCASQVSLSITAVSAHVPQKQRSSFCLPCAIFTCFQRVSQLWRTAGHLGRSQWQSNFLNLTPGVLASWSSVRSMTLDPGVVGPCAIVVVLRRFNWRVGSCVIAEAPAADRGGATAWRTYTRFSTRSQRRVERSASRGRMCSGRIARSGRRCELRAGSVR